MIEKKEVLEILKVQSELIVELNKRGKQKCLCGTSGGGYLKWKIFRPPREHRGPATFKNKIQGNSES